MQLDTTEQRIMESRGSRHTLVIRKVHRLDFGNYTCVADNQLGKTRKSIQLTGAPKAATFKSSSTGNYRESYNISWEVESHSPIEEYQLLFRRISDDSNHPQPLHVQSQRKFGLTVRNGIGELWHGLIERFAWQENRTYSAVGYSIGMGYTRSSKGYSDWRNVILPASRATNRGVQSMSYVIRGLEPGQQYEAKVQARNKFGWSPISKSFIFQTTDRDMAFSDITRYYEKDEPSTLDDFFGVGPAGHSNCIGRPLSLLILSWIFSSFS
ncbi:hypothetical protein D910_00041 [Dendroctonus ponderosae]|uniref:Fibronectin type-III domain-containing protein n=1 Tax=Dendroctonus ponderosae TaxID=77166 RepID=U4UZ43_DENPD|nr:hypothetical protein D910_00041 [Dendroctonus ponderosae]